MMNYLLSDMVFDNEEHLKEEIMKYTIYYNEYRDIRDIENIENIER